MKKRIISVLILTIIILYVDGLSSKLFLGFYDTCRDVQALESTELNIQPYVFYDTSFQGENPKQLLTYNKNIYLATNEIIYKYDFVSREWNPLIEGTPVETLMGTIKGLTYVSMKDGVTVKNYSKIVSDINNDGKEVYELNLDSNGKNNWIQVIKDGKFCKEIQDGAESYSIDSYSKEDNNSKGTKFNETEFYLRNNNFYVKEKDGIPQVVKEYKEDEVKDASVVKFGDKIFIYGENCGIENIVTSIEDGETKYTCKPISSKKDIVGLTSTDGGHTLFAMSADGNVYVVLLPNTWAIDNKSEFVSEIQYGSNKEENKDEISINKNIYKIVNSTDCEKSYITVNGKILCDTIRDTNGYPNNISRFSEGDNYLYVWSSRSQPIRIDIRDNSVVNMGGNYLFTSPSCNYGKIAKDVDGNVYIINGDATYRYLESDKYYDVNLKVTSIAILNDQCYGVNETGLYRYNEHGLWELIINGNNNGVKPEELLVINDTIHCISEGALYKLNSNKIWEKIDSKVNMGLTSVYYVNDINKKVYFVAKDEKNTFVTIYDYFQNKWSKTMDMPDIKHIKSLAVDGKSIYVGTQYVSEGVAYVYKNCMWSDILPQLNLKTSGNVTNSNLVVLNDNIYFYTDSSENKANFGVWKMKDGNVTEVDTGEKKKILKEIISEQDSFLTCNGKVLFTIKNGQAFRKVS